MSELSDSGSSGLSDGWALVSAQGELEDSDADSGTSSSSIEVMQREAAWKLDENFSHPDPGPQSTSVECTELEQLMKKADAAAAATSDVGEVQPVASKSSTSAAEDAGHLFSLLPLSALKEPWETSHLRRESTGEEEAKTRTTSAQLSPGRGSGLDRASHPDRASHTEAASQMDQASQTDRASPVLSNRRLSLTSLWSVSSKSSREDTSSTSSSDVSFAASTDADSDGHGSSVDTDTDTEPEFVCLETEASSSCTQSTEGSRSRSGVKAGTGSKSSVGSEFNFLSESDDFVHLSVSTDGESLPELLVQQNHPHPHHCQQQQSLPQSLASSRLLSCEDWQPSSHLPEEQAFPVEEEFVDHPEVESSLLQGLPPGRLVERGPAVGDDVEAHQRTPCRLSQSSLEQLEENDAVSPVDSLHHQDLSAKDNILALSTYHPKHVRRRSTHRLKHWLGGRSGLALGALLVLLLAFGMGHWLGATWGQSRQLESQVSYMERLRLARDEHRQCMSQHLHLQQLSEVVLKKEKRLHQETVTELQGKQQVLAKRLKEAEQRVEQLVTASSPHPKESTGEASQKERGKRNKRPGKPSQDSEDQQRADTWRHLYFSMRGEREIGMNASDFLHYLTRGMNASTLLHYLAQHWNASKNWTGNMMANVTFWTSTLLGLRERVVQTVPSVWEKVTSTLSHTYQVLANNLYRSAEDQPSKGDTEGNVKGREKGGWTEEESDEEVYLEVEEDSEIESQDYNDWEVTREGHKTNVANDNWAEEEDEYIDIDAFDHARKEHKESKDEDETCGDSKHKSRWSGIMNKLLKKTGKALSHVGKRLQKTWHKVKDTSWQLWSKNSALSRMAARVTNSVSRFSSKIQKKAQGWFKKKFKGGKRPEAFNKHERKKTHAGRDQDWKKADYRHNKTQHATTSDKLRDNKKNKQKFDKSDEAGSEKYQTEKHGSSSKIERKSGRLNRNGVKEAKSNKVGQDQKSDKSDKQIKSKKIGTSQTERNKTEKPDKLDRNRKKEEPMNKNDSEDKTKPKSSKHGQNNKLDKLDKIKVDHVNKQEKDFNKFDSNKNERSHEFGGSSANKERSGTLNQIKKRSNKSDVEMMGEIPTHHHSLSNPAIARTKFRLQSQFQELFSKVGSMDKEAFRSWNSRDVSKMADNVLTMAQRYNSKLHLGLPATGSRWLKCQHGFWVGAMSHHVDYEPTQNCFRFLAPWQITLLEEEDAEISSMERMEKESILAGNENDGEDWNSLTNADPNNEDDTNDSVGDEDHFEDDCHVYSDENNDDEWDGNSDDEIQEHLLPEGEREEDENTNSLTKAEQSAHSQQPPGETNQAWYIHAEDHKADWMFERAMERDEARRESHKADWVFERAAERDANRQKKGEDNQGKRKQKPEPQYTRNSERRNYQHRRGRHEYSGDDGFEYQDRNYRRKYGRASFC